MEFDVYKFIPKKEIKNAAIFSGMFIFVSVALWIISVFVIDFKMIYIFSGLITATAAIQVTSRFIMTGYIYILDKTDFKVYRVSGKKSVQICNISLENTIGISEKNKKTADIEKQFGKITVKINLCQNLLSHMTYSYIFDLDGKKSLIKFECGENFISEMKRRIEYATIQFIFEN